MKGYMEPSSFTLFARKVNGSEWSKRMIWRKFDRQVDKDDYAKKERFQILQWLYELSEPKSGAIPMGRK